MQAKLIVETTRISKNGMATGGTEWEDYTTPDEWGKIQREQKGCATCHSIDGSQRAGSQLERNLGQNGNIERR